MIYNHSLEGIKNGNRYRTATTAYPCSLPGLGDSAGAGRTSCRAQRYNEIFESPTHL